MARYKRLAEKIIGEIQSGKLTPGSRMLSLRQFARQHEMSVSTAVSCYEELESLGWLTSRPQAGFFVSSRDVVQPPSWSSFISRESSPVYQEEFLCKFTGPLGMSCLSLNETTVTELERSFRRASKRMGERITKYPEFQGEMGLRQALVGHFRHYGFSLTADELVITHGCIDAVRTALEVCTHPGDTVAISSPCYNGLLKLLAQMSLKIIEIPSLEDGIDLEQLSWHLEAGSVQAGLFCTTHMNPQGITMSVEQKQRLAQLAAQYQIPVIEDDVYFELSQQHHFSLPATYYDQSGYMIWCGSFSKSLSPSYRLGWCRPGRFMASFIERALGVATPMQLAMTDFIESGLYMKHLKMVRHQLILQTQDYRHYLQQYLPENTRITQPQGGLVLWIQVPGLDSDALAQAALQAGVDIRVGSQFTSLGRYRDCLRINIGYPFDETIRVELDRLIALIRQLTDVNGGDIAGSR
ncbi:aminotransferase-like domain-containing protein [Vibrio mangrovi]|uniref:PLP-dependent aminotransferase family protein n=1 Tax=Vibrio mangrovi TaxID=474394 RepID=A0A1Y6ISA5_9VIBR|nr:PLP-dependent aminotransferase family protein [Vibrio mangrovi]MDW6003527.1 PLP-dependent aminotransferase family protein [Vibrio mangrovi]SMR99680.1 putative HTH-type transcriptional regulator YjiR [Vibrio mangrovi]